MANFNLYYGRNNKTVYVSREDEFGRASYLPLAGVSQDSTTAEKSAVFHHVKKNPNDYLQWIRVIDGGQNS